MSRLTKCSKTSTKKSTKFNVPEIEEIPEGHENTKSIQQQNSHNFLSSNLFPKKASMTLNPDLTKFYFTYDYQNGSGELYMRVGTAIFSICALISRCLTLVQMLENYFNNHSAIIECKLTFTVAIVTKIFCILFIFLQSFFIFKYANIVIHYGKNTALIGLMHIVSTNFCLFIRTVVAETVSEISEIRHAISNHITWSSSQHIEKSGNAAFYNITSEHKRSISDNDYSHLTKLNLAPQSPDKFKHLGCISTGAFTTNISLGIQEAQDKISAYLYPCIIEYSLMSMTIFYILWASIKSRYDTNNKFGSYDVNMSETKRNNSAYGHIKTGTLEVSSEKAYQRINNLLHEKQQINKFTIDCGKSTTGLFLGMFVLLLTVIFTNYSHMINLIY